MGVAEYHSGPVPHLLLSADTWEDLKSTTAAVAVSSIAGQTGSYSGLPVYVDGCPSLWACCERTVAEQDQ